jgi:uncharacterized protein
MKTLLPLFFFVLFSQTNYAINPVRDYPRTPKDLGLNYEELKLDTQDGYSLNTWILEPAPEKRKDYTFVLAYGDAGNMSYSLPYAAALVARGYPVVLFDYRGFGHSSYFVMNLNQYYYNEFVTDFETVLQWIKRRQPQQKIGVWAFSMGTMVATLGYKETPFDLLIGEAFVINPLTTALRIQNQKGKTLALPKGAKKVAKRLNKIDIPMLVVCGKTDNITTLQDGKAITDGYPKRKLLAFEGDHLRGAMLLGFEKYLNKIEQMMLKN